MTLAPSDQKLQSRTSQWEMSGALFEVFMQAPTPLAVLSGPEHRFMFVNPPYVRLARRTSGESFLGKSLREAMPELEGQGFYELLDTVYTTGVPFVGKEIVGTLAREDGLHEEVYFDFVYQPIRGEDGHVKGIMVQATEVTEQVRARQEGEQREQILHRQWSELESIYRTAPVGLCLINATTFEFMRANYLQSVMNGHSAEYLIGKTVRQIAPAVADDVEALFRRVAAGEVVQGMELAGELPHQPGVRHEWIVSYFPIFAENGTVEALSCVTLEVTAQKRAEAELRESQARLSAIYSSSLEHIGLLSPDGLILDCNNSSLAFAGNTHDEVFGKPFWDGPWFQHTPGAQKIVQHAVAAALNGEVVRIELPLVRPSGEVTTFDFSLSPVRNDKGEIIFLVPEAREISDLKRTQTALIQSEKLAAVGRLASSIAHEINNPLESVTNLIFLARQQAVIPEVQELLDLADQELRRVSVIANQTLRFHKQASNPQSIGSAELFASVLRIYEARIRNSHIVLEQRGFAAAPVVCFQGDIRQVLLNVVGNAIDAMPQGGRLLVRSHEARDWATGRRGITITVADTGTGIDPQTLPHIFEPFFTTKGIIGNGLGLWISQEIMERHHGRILVRSSQNQRFKGTVVSLFLPFEHEEILNSLPA